MESIDFSKYGGREIQSDDVPDFSKYGGRAIDEPKKKSLLSRAGEAADYYINNPIGSAAAGFQQGISNVPVGLANLAIKGANLIPGVNVKPLPAFDFAPNNMNAKAGEFGSYFAGPGIMKALSKAGEATGIARTAMNSPFIRNAIEKASSVIKGSPRLSGVASNAASGAFQGAIYNPDNQGMGAVLGGVGGGLAGVSGTAAPWIAPAARSTLGGLVGYGVDGWKGAVAGAGIGLGAPKLANQFGLTKEPAALDFLNNVPKEDVAARYEANKRLGTRADIGEVSNNPVVGSKIGTVSNTAEGAQRMTNEAIAKNAEQRKAIENFKNSVSPPSRVAGQSVRDAAQDYIAELKRLRDKEASPLYKESEKMEIPQHELDSLLETPRIKKTYSEILKDPDYQKILSGSQPTGKKMMAMVENRIDGLISKAQEKPYNKSRIEELKFARKNVATDYENPRVQSVLDEIYKNDPVFHATAMGVNARSGQMLDLVKKRIDQTAENMVSGKNPDGRDKFKASLIGDASRQIRDTADKYIEPYNKARSVFSSMSPEIDQAENGIIGQIANLKNKDVKGVSELIFDPSQTNLNVLKTLKNAVMRKNPQAWDAIVRSEIQRLNSKGPISAASFYQKVLSNDNLYDHFKLALDHNPEALSRLEDMKKGWEFMTKVQPGKNARFMSESKTNAHRTDTAAWINWLREAVGGKRIKEKVDFLNDPNWIKQYDEVAKYKSEKARKEALSDLIAKSVAEFSGRAIPAAYTASKSNGLAG